MSSRPKRRSGSPPGPSRTPSPRPGPPGGKRDQNRKLRIRQLEEAGLILFLTRGIESVTIDEIVEQAGLAKGSFYRYFDGKAALIAHLFEPMKTKMAAAFDTCEEELGRASSPETLNAAYVHVGESIAGIVLEAPDLVRLYLQECRSPLEGARAPIRALADAIEDRAVDLTRIAHERGLLRPIDGRVSSRVVVGAAEKIIYSLLCGKDLGNPLEIAPAVIQLVMDGLRTS